MSAQLDLFDVDRLPAKPYCSDDLQYGVQIRPLKTAINRQYIQLNRPGLRLWLTFDIDRAGGAIAWESANLPTPAWGAANPENGHAHLVYGLAVPVLTADCARRAPIRFLQGIEGAYCEALQADRSYAGLLTKNPLHARWRVLHGLPKLWTMHELAEYGDVEKFVPRRGNKIEEYGLGRNVILFDFLRAWAYRNIRHAREYGKYMLWLADCTERALRRNGDFMTPLDQREVAHVTKSVAKWTWQKFDLAGSDRRFQERQSKRGKLSGEARYKAGEEKRASARLMRAKGMSIRGIAEELAAPKSTVSDWLK